MSLEDVLRQLSRILLCSLIAVLGGLGASANARTQFDGLSCSRDLDPLECMVCNVYFESRGESHQGKVAVAGVVFTRLYAPQFKDRVCENIYAKSQFSWTADGKSDVLPRPGQREYPALREVIKATYEAFFERGPNGYTHFHATWANPAWSHSKECNRKRPLRIGGHIFYDCGGGDAAIRAHERFLKRNEGFAFPQPRPDWYDDEDFYEE